MRTGTQSATVGSAGQAPLREIGALAGLLAEIQSLSPAHLRKIEQVCKDFYAARDEADKKLQESQTRLEAAETTEAELEKRKHEHVDRVNQDIAGLDRREADLARREAECKKCETDIKNREETVAVGERSINRIREQLTTVGAM